MLDPKDCELLASGASLAGRFPAEAASIDEIRAAFAERSSITLAFGGHFKAGKSSLVSALLGRRILPVWDRPKTGVACWIRAGAADRALLMREERLEPIPCTLEAIDQATALLGNDGRARTELASISKLFLELANVPLRGPLNWIDCPGLNDTREMDQRLREAAEEADLLVWVLSSRQPLSQTEQQFLASHMARRGVDSVIFVLNLFLFGDLAGEWNRQVEELVPFIHGKVHEFLRTYGGGSGQEALIFTASSRGILEAEQGYGREALLVLADPGWLAPLVARARSSRFALALAAARFKVGARGDEVLQAFESAKAAHARTCSELQKDWQSRMQIAGSLVDRFLASFAQEARRAGNELAASLESGSFRRGADYGALLSQELRKAAGAAYEQFGFSLESAALPAAPMPDFLSLPQLTTTAPSAGASAGGGAIAGMCFGLFLILIGLGSGDTCFGCGMVVLGAGVVILGLVAGGMLGGLLGKLTEKGSAQRIAAFLRQHTEQTIASISSRRDTWMASLAGPAPVFPLQPSLGTDEQTLLRVAAWLRQRS